MKKLRWIKPVVVLVVVLTLVGAIGGAGARYSAKNSRAIAKQTLPSLSHLTLANQYRGEAFLYLVLAVNSIGQKGTRLKDAEIIKLSDLSQKELERYETTIQTEQNRALYLDVMTERKSYIHCRDEILSCANPAGTIRPSKN